MAKVLRKHVYKSVDMQDVAKNVIDDAQSASGNGLVPLSISMVRQLVIKPVSPTSRNLCSCCISNLSEGIDDNIMY